MFGGLWVECALQKVNGVVVARAVSVNRMGLQTFSHPHTKLKQEKM